MSFSENPTGGDSCVIEASFGQGQGVVDGMVTPDRWLVSQNGMIDAFLGAKKMKVALLQSGIHTSLVSGEDAASFCLSRAQVTEVAQLSRRVAEARNAPSDIEWAYDEAGKLWLLQARDITTKTMKWEPPGPGTWLFDSSHNPKPVTRIFDCVCDSLEEGFRESGRKTGSLLETVVLRIVNGMTFLQPIPVREEDVAERFSVASNYFFTKGWREDWRVWREEIVPQRNAHHLELKKVELGKLDRSQLKIHWRKLVQNLQDSLYYHHIHTWPLATGIGWFLVRGGELTGSPPDDLLNLFEGQSLASRGIWNEEITKSLRSAVNDNPKIVATFMQTGDTSDLSMLLSQNNTFSAALREWMWKYDHYTIGSMDGSQQTYRESPSLIFTNLRHLCSSASPHVSARNRNEEEVERIASCIKNKSDRDEFLQIFEDAVAISDWRDERGLVNEVQATGLIRLFLKFVHENQKISLELDCFDRLLDCSVNEIEGLLQGESVLSAIELKKRNGLRQSSFYVPPFLGSDPAPPPDLLALPIGVREAELARSAFFNRLLSPSTSCSKTNEDSSVLVSGICAHPGQITGTARVLREPEDWKRVCQGDIAIVTHTTASFSALFPLFKGVIADFGGTLSHCAISAREYGIPCIVSTLSGTRTIEDGAFIFMDARAGVVKLEYKAD